MGIEVEAEYFRGTTNFADSERIDDGTINEGVNGSFAQYSKPLRELFGYLFELSEDGKRIL